MTRANLLRVIVLGRKDGLRARLRRRCGLSGSRVTSAPEAKGAERPAREEVVGSGVAVGGQRPLEPPRDVTPPDGFEVILHRDALGPGELTEVIIAGTAIAVSRIDDAYHAISNTCPHAGGPLGDGTLEGEHVVCPYHGWAFDVRTGQCKTNAESSVSCFEVRVVGDAVCVRL